MHTTLALSHLQLGLADTRAHDVFVNRQTGERTPYGHHPPGTALTIAAAFALTGSDAPAVARLTVIAFHIGSMLLLTAMLGLLLDDDRRGLLGGLVMATLPMSAYFGRMVNYEPICLFGIMLLLFGYVRFKRYERSRDLVWVALGIIWGGLVDWPSFFFAAALAVVEMLDLARRRTTHATLLVVLVTSATTVFAFDLWHLWYAGRGAMQAFGGVLSSNQPLWHADLTIGRFMAGQTDTFRRYFTEVGLMSVLLAVWSLARPGARLSRRLFDAPSAPLLRRLLAASGGAALAYVLAAPNWAMMHQVLAVLLSAVSGHLDRAGVGSTAAHGAGSANTAAADHAGGDGARRADCIGVLGAVPAHAPGGVRDRDDGKVPVHVPGAAQPPGRSDGCRVIATQIGGTTASLRTATIRAERARIRGAQEIPVDDEASPAGDRARRTAGREIRCRQRSSATDLRHPHRRVVRRRPRGCTRRDDRDSPAPVRARRAREPRQNLPARQARRRGRHPPALRWMPSGSQPATRASNARARCCLSSSEQARGRYRQSAGCSGG